MKNYTISWKPYETTLEGDSVSMELLPLKRKEMLALTPLLSKHAGFLKQIQSGEMPEEVFQITEAILDKVAPWIDLHVKGIQGFQLNGGEPKASQLIDEAVFSNFILGVIMELVMRSTLKEQEVRD